MSGFETRQGFDLQQYNQVLDSASHILDELAEYPYDRPSMEGFWSDPVIAASLSQRAHVDSTIGMIDSFVRLGAFSTLDESWSTSWSAENVAEDSADHLFQDGLADKLLDIAETEPGSNRSIHIADLLLVAVSQSGSASIDQRVKDHILANLPNILGNAENKVGDIYYANTYSESYIRGAGSIIADTDAAAHPQLKALLVELNDQQDPDSFKVRVIKNLAARTNGVNLICELLGLPSDGEISSAWRWGYGSKAGYWDQDEYQVECVRRMLKFENQHPGICRTLYRSFGIRNFARFPESMLLDQYRERFTHYDRHIYLLSATYDSNGSATRGSIPKLERLRQQLRSQGVGMTVIEVRRKAELKVRARQAKLARHALASAIVFDGHGYGGDVSLGEGYLTSEDIRQWAGELAASVSRQDSVFAIDACSTGQSDTGFAAILSEVADREVLGATGSMALRSISVDFDPDGKPVVNMTNGINRIRRFTRPIRQRDDYDQHDTPEHQPVISYVPERVGRIRSLLRRFNRLLLEHTL